MTISEISKSKTSRNVRVVTFDQTSGINQNPVIGLERLWILYTVRERCRNAKQNNAKVRTSRCANDAMSLINKFDHLARGNSRLEHRRCRLVHRQSHFMSPRDDRDLRRRFSAALILSQWLSMPKFQLGISLLDSINDEVRRYFINQQRITCLLYTSPSPRDATLSRMPSSA